MADSASNPSSSTTTTRPSLPQTQRTTHIRHIQHHDRLHNHHQQQNKSLSSSLPITPTTLDNLVLTLSIAGVAGYIYTNSKRLLPAAANLTTWELAGLGIGSLGIGWGLFDLGRNTAARSSGSFPHGLPSSANNSRGNSLAGSLAGSRRSSFAGGEESDEEQEDWKVGTAFENQAFHSLGVADKISWLRMEESVVRDRQEALEARCGKAFVRKEEAFKKYEKLGGYGGADWKRYAEADKECKGLWRRYERGMKRLEEIEKEVGALLGED